MSCFFSICEILCQSSSHFHGPSVVTAAVKRHFDPCRLDHVDAQMTPMWSTDACAETRASSGHVVCSWTAALTLTPEQCVPVCTRGPHVQRNHWPGGGDTRSVHRYHTSVWPGAEMTWWWCHNQRRRKFIRSRGGGRGRAACPWDRRCCCVRGECVRERKREMSEVS